MVVSKAQLQLWNKINESRNKLKYKIYDENGISNH